MDDGIALIEPTAPAGPVDTERSALTIGSDHERHTHARAHHETGR
jgi:hypothetical protein